ncbi:MAG: OmpA family protein [Rhodothermales bacterium]|nr:OmpA family protein [Rhodothermales bacterium]
MAKIEEEPAPSAPFWLVTYGDMVTLLLTFFVMIVAMSEIKKDKMMEAMSYFNGRNSVFNNAQPVPVIPQKDPKEIEEEKREQADRVEALIDFIETEGLQGSVQVNYEESTVHIVITDSVMFSSGSSQLLGTAQRVLAKVAGVAADTSNTLTVIGHTDNIPIRTSAFPSNWELSASRAASVVRFLLTQSSALPADHYQAIGRGEFQPVATNRTPDGRSRNRRIELLISLNQWQNQTQQKEREVLTP